MKDDIIEIIEPSPVPIRALGLSVLALSVPVLSAVFFPEWMSEDQGILLWLTIFIPPFLLTYYRGWRGASVGLAAGMAVLVVVHLGWVLLAMELPGYDALLWITASYVGVCVGIGLLAELLRRERQEAEEMALTDDLTGLPNRRHAELFLNWAFAAATRGQAVTVVMFDLDRFKNLNDRYGHAAGDEVLRRIGPMLRDLTRKMDICARWGGEEFLAVLCHCRAGGGLVFADRVRGDLVTEEFPWGAITASAGIAEYEPGMGSPELLVAAADQALYQAKSEGRDRCHVWTSGGDTLQAEGADDAAQPMSTDPDEKPGPAKVEGMAGGTERIFVVDDDMSVRKGLARVLARIGYDVAEFAEGRSALTAAHSHGAPDLLLTDLIMPEMSGFVLASRMEEEVGAQRVLYMSAYSQDRVSWRGAPGSLVGFVSKPMTVQELAGRIRGLLDRPFPEPTESSTQPVPKGT